VGSSDGPVTSAVEAAACGISDLPLPERQPVRVHGCFLACAAGDVVEAAGGHVFPGLGFEGVGVGGYGGELVV